MAKTRERSNSCNTAFFKISFWTFYTYLRLLLLHGREQASRGTVSSQMLSVQYCLASDEHCLFLLEKYNLNTNIPGKVIHMYHLSQKELNIWQLKATLCCLLMCQYQTIVIEFTLGFYLCVHGRAVRSIVKLMYVCNDLYRFWHAGRYHAF